jgi:hypothetical protein
VTGDLTTSLLTPMLLRMADTIAGEAGAQAWSSLAGMLRRAFRRTAPQEAPDVSSPPGTEEQARTLAGALLDLMRTDPEFAGEFRHWVGEVGDPRVENVIQGNAQVKGPAIQARDIHGGLNF